MDAFGLLVLRLGIGGLMLGHGLAKLQMVLAGEFAKFPDPIGMGQTASLISATLAEFGGSLLVIVGFWTRFGAATIVFTMAVGVFVVHANDPWFMGPGVALSKEPALFYCIAFLALVCTGAGSISMDAKIQAKRHPQSPGAPPV